MDRETTAVIANAEELARWAAKAVVETDELIEVTAQRPLTYLQQHDNLVMQRELLVRISQQGSLLEWAAGERAAREAAKRRMRAPWWLRAWRYVFPGK